MSGLDEVFEDLRVEIDGKVAILTLDRPDNLNAFSGAMGRSLTTALRAADADDAVRVVVLTGAGRAFCAGADFSGGSGVFGAPTKETFSSDPLDDFHPWNVRKPVIAAINGHAVGLGLTMTLQCDIRIVAEEAKLGIVQARRGILPDLHSHWTLPRLVGHGRATELMLTGRMFGGADAVEWGLATEALPADEVLPRALALAQEMAARTAPVSVGASKRLLWMNAPAPDAINTLERDIHLHLMGSADAREGVMAYMEKRDPEWSLTLGEDWPEWLDELHLIVGAENPAESIAAGLTAVGWSVLRLDDDDLPWADDTVAAAAADSDGLDLVVHARYPAEARRRSALVDLSPDAWHRMADEPLEAAIRLARGAYGGLAASSGTMVFLVPLMASAGGEGFAAMATAAEGIRILAKSLAKTWGHDGIRVHAITLDPSAFLDEADAAGMAEANSLHDPPLGRIPDLASEVARIVDALTHDDFATLLGASLVVDGGLWMPG